MKFVNKMIIRKKPQYEETITCGTVRIPNYYEMAEWNQDIQSFDRIILEMVETNENCCVPIFTSPAC